MGVPACTELVSVGLAASSLPPREISAQAIACDAPHLHWRFHDFPKTAALSTMVVDHHSFAPAIAEFLDLESLVQVRSLTTESRHYQQHLMEARKIERLKREEKAREEERIEADASEIFENRYPMLEWWCLVTGDYMAGLPEDVPSPRFWRGYARRLQDLWWEQP